jgi:bifunctional non-homologous end joining protein LigD
LKLDGFRALAFIEGHHCRLVSRNGHTFKHWPYLNVELAHAVRCDSAVLDGEIVAFDNDGRPNFHKLLFRREWPHFCAFDVLMLNGRDLRTLPLIERKARLKAVARGKEFEPDTKPYNTGMTGQELRTLFNRPTPLR